MSRTVLLVSACLLGLSFTPAVAMDAKCDDATMSDMNTKISAMTDAKMQKTAMSEMDKAGTAMKKHQMKSCVMHMNKAMKSMGTM
jgi:hypothetical protein